MLTELLRVFLTFGIALPAGTTTMFRALVTLQGTLECLCPEYPVVDAAQNLASTLLTTIRRRSFLPCLNTPREYL